MSLVMYTGDLKPDLQVVCSADTAVNLTAATSVRIIGKRGGVLVFDRTPTLAVVGATTVASMLWQAGDTDNIGRITVEVEATWPGGKKQTFRADGGVDIRRDFDQEELLPPEGNLTAEAADAYVLAVLEYEGGAYDAVVDIAATTPSPPNGGAGGVLSGSYPNPGFAVNMAEQGELDAVAALKANRSLPAYVATTVAGNYNQSANAYNWKASNTRKLRAALGRASVGGFQAEVVVIGTSQAAASFDDALVFNELRAWPLYMRDEIARHGVTVSGTGFVRLVDGSIGADSRWTTSGVWATAAPSVGYTITNGATATFTTDKAGDRTSVFYYDDASGATFTISVNGAVSGNGFATVTASGAAGWKKINLLNAPIAAGQTVVITKTSGGVIYLSGACVWTGAGGLLVHNLAQSGSVAKGTSTGAWEATSSTLHLGQVFAAPCVQLVSPDAVIIGLGVNDKANNTGTDAEIRAAITVVRNRYPNADCILVTGTPLADTTVSDAVWETYVGGLYGLADTLDVPLIDTTARLGRWSTMVANGMNGDLVGHLRDEAAADIGRGVGQLLTT